MDWITCPGCGLKHSPRPDGLCPRCRTQAGASSAPSSFPPPSAFARPQFDAPPSPTAPRGAGAEPGEPLPTEPWGGGPPMATTPVGGAADVTVGSLISRTFSVWWANVGRFALLLLPIVVPVMIGVAVLGANARDLKPEELLRAFAPLIITLSLAGFLLVLVYYGAVTVGVLRHLAGRPASVGTMLGAAFRRLWPLFLVSIATLVMVWIGMLLLLVPGIVLAVMLSLTLPVLMAEEGAGAGTAISRSFALTKGRRLTLFAAFFVIVVALWLLGAAGNVLPAIAGSAPVLALVFLLLNVVIQVAVAPLAMILCAVAYHDLRVAKEGVDTSQLAQVFE